MKAIKANEIDCDLWLGLWLSCASVEVDSEKVRIAKHALDVVTKGFAQSGLTPCVFSMQGSKALQMSDGRAASI